MTKVVIMNEAEMTSIIGPTGPEHRKWANRVMAEALSKAGLAFEQIEYVVATGYGRINVPFADKQITEISCHARGVSIIGGTGTILGVVLGSLFMGIVNNALTVVNLSPFYQMAIQGFVILAAIIAAAVEIKPSITTGRRLAAANRSPHAPTRSEPDHASV
jgi:hypothetical protein